jgi:hypothetical protein
VEAANPAKAREVRRKEIIFMARIRFGVGGGKAAASMDGRGGIADAAFSVS